MDKTTQDKIQQLQMISNAVAASTVPIDRD